MHAFVAPLTGAWIEIGATASGASGKVVAPLTGAWIEIKNGDKYYTSLSCRSPHGSVD